MAKTKKEEVINEETVDLNEVLDLEVKLEKPQLDLKDAIRNYFDESFKKLEDEETTRAFWVDSNLWLC